MTACSRNAASRQFGPPCPYRAPARQTSRRGALFTHRNAVSPGPATRHVGLLDCPTVCSLRPAKAGSSRRRPRARDVMSHEDWKDLHRRPGHRCRFATMCGEARPRPGPILQRLDQWIADRCFQRRCKMDSDRARQPRSSIGTAMTSVTRLRGAMVTPRRALTASSAR